MHHIYQTKAFVLTSRPFGEANRLFRILTKDLGLINASAQGVRFLKSKLRYSIHEFSYCEVSLVRGKDQWRITGVSKQADIYSEFRKTPDIFHVFARVFSLLERLLPGEDKNELLFKFIEESFNFAQTQKESIGLIKNLEYILVLRILFCLGYLGSSPDTEIFVQSPYWDRELIDKMDSVVSKVLGEINKSLKETQL